MSIGGREMVHLPISGRASKGRKMSNFYTKSLDC